MLNAAHKIPVEITRAQLLAIRMNELDKLELDDNHKRARPLCRYADTLVTSCPARAAVPLEAGQRQDILQRQDVLP